MAFSPSPLGRRVLAAALCALLGLGAGLWSGFAKAAPLPAAARLAGADSAPEEEKLVCLTFDDGPSRNTSAVLAALNREGVPATFFVIATGYNDEYLPLIAEARAAGHQIALHSASHDYSEIYRSPEAFWADQDLLRERLSPYLEGETPAWLRFPGGSTNTISRRYGGADIMARLKAGAEARGLHWVDWNVCGEDAAGEKLTPGEIYRNVLNSTRGQSRCIVLLHDSASTSTTPEALPDIIRWYKSEGYAFCTIAELYGK